MNATHRSRATGTTTVILLAALLAAAAGCPSTTTGSSSSSTSSSSSSSSSGGASGSSGGGGGTVGAGCDTANPCGAFKGSALACEAGTCALPGCSTGTLGCPCNAGTCDSASTCQDAVCVMTGCTPGAPGCGCASDMCNGGTQCVAGFCRYPTRLGIRVDSTDVRACDLLIQEQGRTIQSVAFGAGAIGEHVRRGGRWALSFTRRADEAGQGAVATLEFGGMTAVTAAEVRLAQVRCFDGKGQPVASPGVSVQ